MEGVNFMNLNLYDARVYRYEVLKISQNDRHFGGVRILRVGDFFIHGVT